MESGYVLNFTDQSFSDFFVDTIRLSINDEKYCASGKSKAKRLRAFWRIESDAMVGRLLESLIGYFESDERSDSPNPALVARCKAAASRLSAESTAGLGPLKGDIKPMDSAYLEQQIHRMEGAVESDPPLAVGTAKELIETVCKTILKERGSSVPKHIELVPLAKLVLEELRVESLFEPASGRGGEKARRILGNLASVAQGVAELRNQYGTGHGKVGTTSPLDPLVAVVAVGAAATYCRFVLRFHKSHPPAGVGFKPWDPRMRRGGSYTPADWNTTARPIQPTLG